MNRSALTAAEIISYLKHSSLPTVLVEGRDDMIIYSWLGINGKITHVDLLACNSRSTLLSVYDQRQQFSDKTVIFVADKDMFLFSTIPSQYHEVIWTNGYSIENDLLHSSKLRNLLSSAEQVELRELRDQMACWFAFEVNEYLEGRDAKVDIHINEIVPVNTNSICQKFRAKRGFSDPPKTILRRIKKSPDVLIRGKNILQLYGRILNSPKRKSKYSYHNILELAAKITTNQRMKALKTKIEKRIAPNQPKMLRNI